MLKVIGTDQVEIVISLIFSSLLVQVEDIYCKHRCVRQYSNILIFTSESKITLYSRT